MWRHADPEAEGAGQWGLGAAMEGAGYRVLFEKGGVYLHTSAKKHQDPDSLIAGVIRVVEKDNDVLLHWAPVEEAGDSTQIVFSKKTEPSLCVGVRAGGLAEGWARKGSDDLGAPLGAEPSPARDSWAFSVSLGELKSIRRSKPGLSWAYLVLVTQAGGSLPALHFHRGGTRALLRVLSHYLLLASSPQDSRLYLVFPHDSSALSNSFHHLQLFDQDSSNVVSRFLQDPYSTTFSSFSRVTNFFRGALQPHPEGVSPDLPPPPDDEPEPGFEVISCVELGPRPAVERTPPVTEEEWARHVGPEGRLQQVPELKARIFSGGLSPGLRREAWKFLLGYLSWEQSAEEHKALVRKKTGHLPPRAFGRRRVVARRPDPPLPQHINELTMKLSVEDVLTRAEALYRQLTACAELPLNVQEVLGLVPPAEPGSPSPPTSPLPLSPSRAPPAPPAPTDTAPQPDSSLEILPEEEEEEEGGGDS
ncbi:PREDICTED: TBC1 domain family member 17 [Condylura cristata]|uniref:TBC1 domain family member 17 n=1 Tax=Condylura cristata TaxID=143302 RepID=UPI0006438A35|nr:PREDICTED: TBC1 domain family member 17 [Condylura cristata]